MQLTSTLGELKKYMTTRDDENIARQQTYFHYMKSIELRLKCLSYECIANDIALSNSFKRITTRPGIEYDRIGELLRNAWFTEHQMTIANGNGFHEFSNHWIPIQMYYCCYLLIRCIELAKQTSGNGEHSSSLKFIANYINDSSDLFPDPWRIIYLSNSIKPQFINMPDNTLISNVCTLSNPQYGDFYSSFATFLRTTNTKIIGKKIEDWKAKNKVKKIPSSEKKKIIEHNGKTSLFNCMYRMRLRSNYEDADAFITTIGMPILAKGFSDSIIEVTSKSLLVLEMILCRHISKNRYKDIIESYSIKVPNSETMRRYSVFRSKF